MLSADAIYAAAERSDPKLSTDRQIARAERIVRRFLRELPGEITVADIRADLEEQS